MALIEDSLVKGWKDEEKRSFLDLATGGRAKHGGTGKYKGEPGAIPPLSNTGKVTPQNLEWLYDKFFPDEVTEIGGHKVMGGMPSYMEAVTPVGIIGKANTAQKMFSGWSSNFGTHLLTLGKKARRKMQGVLQRAFDDLSGVIDSGDINQVQQTLFKINKEHNLNKFVKVPDVTTEGIAGGAVKQAKKVKGGTVKETKRIVNRQNPTREEDLRGLQRGSRRSGKK